MGALARRGRFLPETLTGEVVYDPSALSLPSVEGDCSIGSSTYFMGAVISMSRVWVGPKRAISVLILK